MKTKSGPSQSLCKSEADCFTIYTVSSLIGTTVNNILDKVGSGEFPPPVRLNPPLWDKQVISRFITEKYNKTRKKQVYITHSSEQKVNENQFNNALSGDVAQRLIDAGFKPSHSITILLNKNRMDDEQNRKTWNAAHRNTVNRIANKIPSDVISEVLIKNAPQHCNFNYIIAAEDCKHGSTYAELWHLHVTLFFNYEETVILTKKCEQVKQRVEKTLSNHLFDCIFDINSKCDQGIIEYNLKQLHRNADMVATNIPIATI